jgi:RNA recognition motif-containing protein
VPTGELKPVDPTRVFLGRLPYSLEDAELNEIFNPLGAKSIERSRNHLFAVATFATAEQAAAVVAQKPTLKNGRTIRVEPENPNVKATRTEGERPLRVRRPRKPVDPALLDNKRVFIGYLPEGVSPENVKSQFAGVSSVELRGKYGYVNFESEQAATAALAKNDTTAFGGEQKIKVEVATRLPRPAKTEASQ